MLLLSRCKLLILFPFLFACFSTALNAALLVHLPLNNNLNDISGNGNNGSLPGGGLDPTFSSAVINQGANFNGVDQFFTIPSTFDPGSTFSVSLWVNHDNIGTLNTFIEHANNGNNRNDFYIGYDNSVNQLTIELEDNNSTEGGACGNPKFCTGIALNSNRWYHIVVTVTPTTLKVYVDTTLAYDVTHTTTVSFGVGSASWLLGGDTDSNPVTSAANDYLDGRIDEVQIYNNELSQTEISSLYGLVAEWNIDQCTLTNPNDITDSSGNNLHASPINGVTTATGKVCTALSLDGVDDYAEVADTAELDITQSLTVMAWINPKSWPTTGLKTIVAKDLNYEFHLNQFGKIQWSWQSSSGGHSFNSASNVTPNTSTNSAALNTWTHVAIVYESGNQRIIINGVESNTRTFTGTLTPNNDTLRIGNDKGTFSPPRNFDGLIDEVKIYNRALSTEEINGYATNPDPLNRTCPSCGGGSSCFADSYGVYVGDQLLIENNISFSSSSGSSTLNNGSTTQSAVALDGTVSNQTTTLTALPAITWVTSPDPDLNDGETLAPGDYDRVRAANNATITLSPGTYNIDEFNLRANVTVNISPAGQVIINTNEFTANGDAIINLAGDPANLIVNIYDQQNAEFDLGDDSNFTGIVYSSFASTLIEIDDGNTFTGAIITAGDVELKDNSTVNYTTAAQTAAAAILGCRLAPTVNSLSTQDSTPTITGTYDSANAGNGFIVNVAGTTYTLGISPELTTSGDNWTLAIASPISNGTYDVVATSTNGSGSSISDITTDELFIGIEPCFADSYGLYVGDQLLIENNISFTSSSGSSTLNNGTTTQSAVALDGTVSNQTTTLTALPAITWVTSPDPDLNDGETLAPGDYDRVRAANNATITLSPGTYNIDEFNLRANVTVNISPAGQVIINTNEFTANGDATINFGGDPANFIVNIYNQHAAEFDLGDDSNFTGIVYSSFSSTLIEIDDGNTFTGAIITAGDVELKDNSSVNYTTAAQTAAANILQCTVSGIHHIEFVHDGIALTCEPEQITVKACANSDCSSLATSSVTATLSPTGWVGGDSKTFTGSANYNLQDVTAGINTLTTSSVTPTPTNAVVCKNIGGTVISCNIEFFDSGFIYTIPTQTSCATSASITAQAVRFDATSQTCVPAFQNVSRNLKIWASYSNPGSGSNSVTMVNGNGSFTLPATEPGSTNVNMSFGATADESFSIAYPDAGQLTLNMKYEGSAGNSDTGLTMSGATTYVTVPAKLYVYSDTANFACASNDGTCTAFKPAGSSADSQFNLKIRAACADNSVTPNFILNTIPITHTNTAPAVAQGSIGVSSFNMIGSDNGEHTISTQTYTEVGAVTFTATSPTYLGETGPVGTSTTIGRFYPHHFDTTVIQACTSYTYSGQPFSVTATARNNAAPPATTQNYTGSFAYNTTLTNAGVNSNFNGTNIVPSGNFSNGIGTKTDVAYTFPAKETVPATITLRANDTDTGSASGVTEGTTSIRSGRTYIENAYASELEDMAVTAETQYYDSNGFITNTADSCATSTISVVLTDLGTGTVMVGDGTTAGETCVWDDDAESGTDNCNSALGLLQFNEPPIAGDFNLYLKAPGADFVGDVGISLTSPTWLQFDWDGDNADDDDPSATASFGLYRGDDRVIYWREVF